MENQRFRGHKANTCPRSQDLFVSKWGLNAVSQRHSATEVTTAISLLNPALTCSLNPIHITKWHLHVTLRYLLQAKGWQMYHGSPAQGRLSRMLSRTEGFPQPKLTEKVVIWGPRKCPSTQGRHRVPSTVSEARILVGGEDIRRG